MLGIVAASALGITSPLCMYGTIPLAASFSEKGMEDNWLAAFMMSSILLNPQMIRAFYQKDSFFNFAGFGLPQSRDSYLILFHFKGHAMADFGGAIKNISIGLGSSEGKVWIHTGGTQRTSNIFYDDQAAFLESIGEADKSVVDALDERIAYINIMNRLSVDCDCDRNPGTVSTPWNTLWRLAWAAVPMNW